MIKIDLTVEEEKILADLLESCIADLRSEIQNTDNSAYKEMLKQRRQILHHLLDEIELAGDTASEEPG